MPPRSPDFIQAAHEPDDEDERDDDYPDADERRDELWDEAAALAWWRRYFPLVGRRKQQGETE